jgi:hypothetical protein
LYAFLFPMCATWPSNPTHLDFVNLIIFGDD